MAVVATLELHNLVASRIAAGNTNGAHRRLGSRGHEAHTLDRRHELADSLGDGDFRLCGGAVAEAMGQLRLQCLDNIGVSMAEN